MFVGGRFFWIFGSGFLVLILVCGDSLVLFVLFWGFLIDFSEFG